MSHMRASLVVTPVRTKHDHRAFVRLPWRIYRDDPRWVAPLRVGSSHALDSGTNPFHREATIEHFLARDDTGRVVGRVASTIHPAYVERHGPKAFFGFFESVREPQVAALLLAAVERWAWDRGMEAVAGPVGYTTTQDVGLLIEGFDVAPALMQPHNPAYYGDLIENCGYKRIFEMSSYTWTRAAHGLLLDDLIARGDEILRRQRVTVRDADMRRFDTELEIIRRLYNIAFTHHPHWVPISRPVFITKAKELKPFIDPGLIRIVEKHGEPLAFALMLPNLNEVLARHNGRRTPRMLVSGFFEAPRIRSAVVVMIGARPDIVGLGLGRVLTGEIIRVAAGGRYDTIHTTWVHERNTETQALVHRLHSAPTRRYAVMEKML
jgi:GNAT superfamily N-acetyltransferase